MKNNFIGAYEKDASRLKGKATNVVHPRNLKEVRDVVIKSNKITPRGAGTGLAGGAVPQSDLVLDLSKMTRIENFDKEKQTIEVEAGVVLDDLQDYVAEFGLEFPVNPSSHIVATIGGMIATNAVGNRGVKYGDTANWVKWVEIVDGYGKVEKKGITEMSDYVGMEGTTGIITRACLKLSPRKIRTASLIKVENLENIVSIVKDLKRNSAVSMVEFLDKFISKGIGLEENYHLIIEYEDGTGSLSGGSYEKLMNIRNRAYPFLAGKGYTRIEDPKIMIDKFPILMIWLEKNSIPTFGHIGVGILHPCFNVEQEKSVPEMILLVKKLGGRVSGEHGIGILKRAFVEINDQKIFRNVKKRTDPLNKFNIGKLM